MESNQFDEKTDPTDDIDDPGAVFNFPFTIDSESVRFLNTHGRIFFIIRGLPGTRKKVLGNFLEELYNGSKMYWADKVFLGPVAGPRSKKAVGESHVICYGKIEKYMQDNVPVIINRNSNVRGFEVTRYIRLALLYGYTIILAETNRKVSTSPELLRLSNTKRLGKGYLNDRVKQWDEIYPLYTGWFLRPLDGLHLQMRYAEISSVAAEKGWNIPKISHAEALIFCLGRLCSFGKEPEDQLYCDSDKVKDSYGAKHTLTVFGYAVVDNIVLAAVSLNEDQLSMIANPDDKEECSVKTATGIQVDDWEATKCSVNLEDVVSATTDREEPSKLEKLDQVPSADTVSFIVLGRTEKHQGRDFIYDKELCNSLKRFSRERMSEGVPRGEQLSLDQIDIYKVEDEFLIVDSRTVQVDTVFTGFYQSYSVSTLPCRHFNSKKGCQYGSICRFSHKPL
ncbi:2',3'-cyclic-nucleotide 3'-phosphodiesterase-like [Ornithodoros turicata]|uniref:2',3'-cyclic-nucleotide 3'-phosphodiesterase-like n=1 Tax=Ornithodoros turicata TaxID=34597 RepID=UPI003139FFA0